MTNPPELRTVRSFIENEIEYRSISGDSGYIKEASDALFALDTITNLIRILQEPKK